MTEVPVLETPRLRLRGWQRSDIEPFVRMNQDPEVMRHLGGPATRGYAEGLLGRFLDKWGEDPDFGWWAVELRERPGFIGFVGLNRPDFEEPPSPCVEIGWRLVRTSWGRGLATEAARACLAHGFGPVGLGEILSFTTHGNRPSQRVMERIGMTRDPGGDFDHPLLARNDPNRRHRLYRITRADWAAAHPDTGSAA